MIFNKYIDKFAHFGAGVIVSLVTFYILSIFIYNYQICAIFGLFTALLAGVAKELHDILTNGKASLLDLLSTLAGGLPIIIVLQIIKWR